MPRTRQTPDDAACACDKEAARLTTLDDAIGRGLALVDPLEESENLPLHLAIGRVLARDGMAALPMPPFDNSAMDGYLVRTTDLAGDGPWELTVT